MRLAILRNPVSTGNLERADPAIPAGAWLEAPDRPKDVLPALERLLAASPDLLVIDGGDGTVRAVVEALPGVFGQAMPPLAILAHGNTNLIARRLGLLDGPDTLARLAVAEAADLLPALHPAPVLRLDFEDGRTRRGFIAGWGAYTAGTRIGRDEIAARHGQQVRLAVMATIWRALTGAGTPSLRDGVPGRLLVDGRARPGERRFVGVVTTLSGPLIGPFAPFWGEGNGPLRWLDIAAPARRLAAAAPLVVAGRPARWMRRAGYGAGRAVRLDLELDAGSTPITVDGAEIGGDGPMRVTITADECVRVLSGLPAHLDRAIEAAV